MRASGFPRDDAKSLARGDAESAVSNDQPDTIALCGLSAAVLQANCQGSPAAFAKSGALVTCASFFGGFGSVILVGGGVEGGLG